MDPNMETESARGECSCSWILGRFHNINKMTELSKPESRAQVLPQSLVEVVKNLAT